MADRIAEVIRGPFAPAASLTGKALILSLGLTLAAASPATAAVYTLSVSGTTSTNPGLLSDETDLIGIIHPAGTSLAGLPFDLTYRIDTSQWHLLFSRPEPDAAITFRSDYPIAYPGNAITASIRIGGTLIRRIGEPVDPGNTATGISGWSALVNSSHGTPLQAFSILSNSGTNTPYARYDINGRSYQGLHLGVSVGLSFMAQPTADLVVSPHAISPFAIDFTTGGNGVGQNGQLSFYSDTTGKQFNAYFDIARVSLTTDPAALPEPASWALLIVGFGLVGTMLRGYPIWRN